MRVGSEAFMDAMPRYNAMFASYGQETPEEKAIRQENERAERQLERDLTRDAKMDEARRARAKAHEAEDLDAAIRREERMEESRRTRAKAHEAEDLDAAARRAERMENDQFTRAEARKMKKETDSATREAELISSVKAGAGFQNEETISGGDYLRAFVWNADTSINKIQGMLSRDELVDARQYFDKFSKIVADNIHDIANLARIHDAGAAGERMARNAQFLLEGGYNQTKITMPDGEQTILWDVLSDDGAYRGRHRNAFKSLGFNETASEMYFGDHGDVARSVARTIMDRRVQDHEAGRPVVFGTQVADLMDYLTEKDGEGKLVNMDRVTGLFGTSTATALSGLMDRRGAVGDFRRSFETYVDIAELMKRDGESGASLASRANAWSDNLMRSTFAGLRDDRPQPVDVVRFDALLKKSLEVLKSQGREADIVNRPSFQQAFADAYEHFAWADNLGIDLVGAADDAGMSCMDQAAQLVAASMAGDLNFSKPGYMSSIAQLRDGLARVRGATASTHNGGVRSEGDLMRKTLVWGSDLVGLDGLAYGFTKEIAKAVVPELKGGRASVDAAWGTIVNDPDKARGLREGVLAHVTRAMPLVNAEVRDAIADTAIGQFKGVGRAGFAMEDVVRAVLRDADAFDDPTSKRQLQAWLTANTDPRFAQMQEVLYKYYTQESPQDPARAAQRTSAKMMDVYEAAARGEDPSGVVDDTISYRTYYRAAELTPEEQRDMPWMQDPKSGKFLPKVEVTWGDVRLHDAEMLAKDPEYNRDVEQNALRIRATENQRLQHSYFMDVIRRANKQQNDSDLGMTL